MKKRTEKQPVDELFARKLKHMSLPPGSDGLARLQARLDQGRPETRVVVFWRNPVMQRFMAVAACLVLVGLFGWLYKDRMGTFAPKTTTVAVNKPPVSSPQRYPAQRSTAGSEPQPVESQLAEEKHTGGLASKPAATEVIVTERSRPDRTSRQLASTNRNTGTTRASVQEATTESAAKPVEQVAARPSAAVTSPVEDTQIVAVNKPAPVAERVLIVTIAEPKALTTARMAAAANSLGEVTEKAAGETKAATIWQQVKRMKQGDVFARKEASDDDRSLLSRAYTGLKQTIDRDKPAKQ